MHRRTALLAVLGLSLLALAAPSSAAAADFPSKDSGYHNYAEMVAEIQDAEADHPNIVDVFSIGKSYQNRNIWAAKVSDNVADDENEPEVLFDGLHHAREHLTVEQTLAILRWLSDGYGSNAEITGLVDTREVWIIFNCQSGRRRVRPHRIAVPRLAQEPPAERGHDRGGHGPQPQLRLPLGLLRRLVGLEVIRHVPRVEGVLRPETRVVRDFINSRVVGGRQQIKTAITFHTAGEEILWPYGYTTDRRALGHDGRRPRRARRDRQADGRIERLHAEAVELAVHHGRRRDRLGVRRAPDLHVHLRDVSLARPGVARRPRFYPPDEVISRETNRNREAVLQIINRAGCLYSAIGKTTTHCGPFFDDFEAPTGWRTNPHGTDTATGGKWVRANPETTTYQSGSVTSGSRALVTAYKAGEGAQSYDVDAGPTTIRSAPITLGATVGNLTFRYYFAHGSNSSSLDSFEAYVEDEGGS